MSHSSRGSYMRGLCFPGNVFLRARDKDANCRLRDSCAVSGTRREHDNPANSGPFASRREISAICGLPGGPRRIRTCNQTVTEHGSLSAAMSPPRATNRASPRTFLARRGLEAHRHRAASVDGTRTARGQGGIDPEHANGGWDPHRAKGQTGTPASPGGCRGLKLLILADAEAH